MYEENRDFFQALCYFLGQEDIQTVDELLDYISKRTFKDHHVKNVIYQYLRKVGKQRPEHKEKISKKLDIFKKTKFKNFFIHLNGTFYNHGNLTSNIELFVNQKLIYKGKADIRLKNIKRALTENISIDLDLKKKNPRFRHGTNPIFRFGTCDLHCCASILLWEIKHIYDEQILIEKIYLYAPHYPNDQSKNLSGPVMITISDLESELKRIQRINDLSKIYGIDVKWKKSSRKGQRCSWIGYLDTPYEGLK